MVSSFAKVSCYEVNVSSICTSLYFYGKGRQGFETYAVFVTFIGNTNLCTFKSDTDFERPYKNAHTGEGQSNLPEDHGHDLSDSHHLQNLEHVLQHLEEYDKCKFMQKSVTYMGCIISAEPWNFPHHREGGSTQTGSKTREHNPTKVIPGHGELQYHGKWIPNLSTILHPLNRLLQKGQEFKWSKECEEAFKLAKKSQTSDKVHYNPDIPLILECDASPYGVGVVMSHRFPGGVERPIAYASRSLNQAEQNYNQIEKEGLAIVFGVTKFYFRHSSTN
ncbi:hypothetical protein QZH41_003499 [Actinostola sp. cb2023]|nr:hypothetical protein QZH41_003499 [Actinostola sp. cb2023]